MDAPDLWDFISICAASKLQLITRIVFIRNRSRHQELQYRIPSFRLTIQLRLNCSRLPAYSRGPSDGFNLRNYATDTIREMLQRAVLRNVRVQNCIRYNMHTRARMYACMAVRLRIYNIATILIIVSRSFTRSNKWLVLRDTKSEKFDQIFIWCV